MARKLIRLLRSRGCNCQCMTCLASRHCRGSECYDLGPGFGKEWT